MKTIFSIGHYSINVFGFFIVIGMIVGYFVTMKEAKRKKYSTDIIPDLILCVIISGIIGARLYYILVFNFDYYDGQLFFTYLIGFSINRFIVEFFRTNPIVINPLTVAHVTSLVLILISFLALAYLKRRFKNNNLAVDKSISI